MTSAPVPQPMLPELQSRLGAGEAILLHDGSDATTVTQGPNGFLAFKMWSCDPDLKTPGQRSWRVVHSFVLGSYGVPSLAAYLARDPAAKMWWARVISEAATTFKDGSKEQARGPDTLENVKLMAVKCLRQRLAEGSMVSQVLITGPAGKTLELSVCTFGEDTEPVWIEEDAPGDA